MTGPLLHRERVRFHDFQFKRLPNGRCRARVDLAWLEDHFIGEGEGLASPTGELRCAAEAALRALTACLASDAVSLDLLGVKAVRAFDATVLIVALSARSSEKSQRLVGSYLAEDDSNRGAALAVLSATNRYLGNYIATR